MSTAKRMMSAVAAACAALLMSQGAALAASKCVGGMAKTGAKVAATKGKDIGACLKSGGGANCINTDSSKVTAAGAKTSATFDKSCLADPPTFGVPVGVPGGTAAAINNAAVDNEEQLAFRIFGSDAETSTDKAGAKCQGTVSKTYEKAVATYNKGFQSCIKSQNDEGGLENCVLSDSGGKGAAALGKLEAGIAKACVGQSVADLFPGTCAGVPLALLGECVGIQTRCYTCRMQNGMHGLHANCDELDDGSENGSCSAGLTFTCDLTDSEFQVNAALATIPVPAVGSIDIATGSDSSGGAASCSIRDVEPFNLPGVGFVCLGGATGCSPGTVDCAGGGPTNTTMNADRNIGACNGHDDCVSQCNTFCGATAGTEAATTGYGCEGFCTRGTHMPCTLDTQCADAGEGACAGPDGAIAGNICECICVNDTLAPNASPGELSCNLGVTINVEVAAPCDGTDTLIPFGTICTPLTTAGSAGVFNNFNLSGQLIDSGNGQNLSCFDYDSTVVTNLNLEGFVPFFGSTLGDLLTGVFLTCQ